MLRVLCDVIRSTPACRFLQGTDLLKMARQEKVIVLLLHSIHSWQNPFRTTLSTFNYSVTPVLGGKGRQWRELSASLGFPGGSAVRICRQGRRQGFHPCFGKIPWRRAQQPTPVFLPGESHGQRSLAYDSSQGHKELDMTEVTEHACPHASTSLQLVSFFGIRYIWYNAHITCSSRFLQEKKKAMWFSYKDMRYWHISLTFTLEDKNSC